MNRQTAVTVTAMVACFLLFMVVTTTFTGFSASVAATPTISKDRPSMLETLTLEVSALATEYFELLAPVGVRVTVMLFYSHTSMEALDAGVVATLAT